MRLALIPLSMFLMMSACKVEVSNGDQNQHDAGSQAAQTRSPNGSPGVTSNPFASHDLKIGEPLAQGMADDKPRPIMQLQVVLDRLGFTPGVVDGKNGLSTSNAMDGFQEANNLPITGKLDDATTRALAQWSNIPATRVVTIPADFAAGPFSKLPKDAAEQAKLPALGYESLDEKLAERFHTTIETLRELNTETPPSSDASLAKGVSSAAAAASPAAPQSSLGQTTQSVFHAGQHIRVPNIGADVIEPGVVKDAGWQETLAMIGVGATQLQAARIVVSKSNGTLKAYDANDKLIGMYTATMGSRHDPLPLGEWKITGVDHNPPFHYNPELLWDVPDGRDKQLLPPGPNGPVGVAWIALSKKHYGIHGTPQPQTIGRAQSHGCVRLTNWDIARLAQMVSLRTRVIFEA